MTAYVLKRPATLFQLSRFSNTSRVECIGFVFFIIAHWRQRAPASISDNKRTNAALNSTRV